MAARRWAAGDPEPPNDEVRTVTGASGTVWARSEPAGLYWWPPPCGSVRHWPELLRIDGPVTAETGAVQGVLFDVEPVPRRGRR
ncbi:hypothetical protein DMP23_47360 [Amycolatopsis sp. A1MSW2902]|uniref:hypothetical protein n=1 Tax=Amycolatopsis sp. A1MSW2902 TaxID=687413 RepID=UPI00307D4FDE